MEKESVFTPEVQGQEKALALLLAQEVREYFKTRNTARNSSGGI